MLYVLSYKYWLHERPCEMVTGPFAPSTYSHPSVRTGSVRPSICFAHGSLRPRSFSPTIYIIYFKMTALNLRPSQGCASGGLAPGVQYRGTTGTTWCHQYWEESSRVAYQYLLAPVTTSILRGELPSGLPVFTTTSDHINTVRRAPEWFTSIYYHQWPHQYWEESSRVVYQYLLPPVTTSILGGELPSGLSVFTTVSDHINIGRRAPKWFTSIYYRQGPHQYWEESSRVVYQYLLPPVTTQTEKTQLLYGSYFFDTSTLEAFNSASSSTSLPILYSLTSPKFHILERVFFAHQY